MKYYYCPMLKEGRGCRYGGNKRYNFGFMSGTDSFCRLVKKWVHDLKTCPRKGEFMTNEDKKIVADYMDWHYAEHEGIYYYDWDGRRQRNLDLNDAGLVVQEMQNRGEWVYFLDYTEHSAYGAVIWYDFISKLFNADNFFSAFVQWRKSK